MPVTNPNYSVNLNSLLPRMNNSDMIAITEIGNTTLPHETNFTSTNFEDYILFNLAQNNSASDISINAATVPVDLSYQDTSITITHPEPNNLKQHVVINNTDDFVSSEKFAMNLTYNTATAGLPTYKDRYVIVGKNGNKIQSNISLKPNTVSYYDSNLKLDITLNEDPQYTTDEQWQVVFDRQYNNMNYFAAINSNLNTNNGSYPFYIDADNNNNPYSLFQDGYYFTGGEQYDSNDNTYLQQRQKHTFASAGLTTLANVNLDASLNNYYQYQGDEFKTYKIVQNVDPSNSITLLMKDESENFYYNTGDNLPVGSYNALNGNYGSADLYDNLIDLSNVFSTVNLFDPSNSLRITDGFTATLTVGENNSGGYVDPSAGSNPIFVLDQSSLTTDGSPENINYFNNHKPRGIHRVDIVNGSVEVEDLVNSLNEQFITVSSGAETLDASFNNTDGSVYLRSGSIATSIANIVADVSNGVTFYRSSGRVAFNYILDGSGNPSGSLNNDFTESVNVYYNSAESLGNESYLSEEVCENNFVQYELELLVESTDSNSGGNTYNNKDTRNICPNTLNSFGDSQDSQLVIASDTQPIGFDLSGSNFSFGNDDTNALIRGNGKVNIFNIKNNNPLVEGGSLFYFDASNNEVNVDGSFCSVVFSDYRISALPYSDYRVALYTKTASDICNNVLPTNGWTFTTADISNQFLIGDPMRVSELFQDDSQFITGASDVSALPVKYTYYIQNADENGIATYRNLNSVRYSFDVSLTDPTADGNRNPISQYKFGGHTDISFIPQRDISDTRLAVISSSYVTATNNRNANDYIYEKWLRRKQYNAAINPSLPFYENILLKTKTIFEEQLYYRVWNKLPSGNKGTEVYSKNDFSVNSDSMSNVHAKLVSSFGSLYATDTGSTIIQNMSTDITLHPEDCCIFKVNLQGIDMSGGSWTDLGLDVSNQVWTYPQSSLDPFIKSVSLINVLGVASCTVTVNVLQETIINQEEYYIEIDNKLGQNNAYTAELYSFNLDDLAESGLLESFSPYLAKFTDYNSYKSNIQYDCSLGELNDDYILTITHERNGVTYTDLTITYNKDYVLNFNIINCPFNLIEVKRTIGRSATDINRVTRTSYSFSTNQTNLFNAEIDDGVYFTHKADLTFGYKESFILKPDKVNVQFVDSSGNLRYPNNDPYWGVLDISSIPIYREITFGNATSLTITNTASTNRTKNVTLHRVRGYQLTTNGSTSNGDSTVTLHRTPLEAIFTLDVSFAYVTRFIDPSYGGLYNQLLPGTGITVIDASSQFVRPDLSLNAIDPSYNYTYERALYRQSYTNGTGSFVLDELVSTTAFTPDKTVNGVNFALNNQLRNDNKAVVNIGLKLNMSKSILADEDTNVATYVLTTSAADYTYEYRNPSGQSNREIVNGDGSGNLFDGILTNFFDLRTRAIYSPFPLSITLRYSSSFLRIYSKNTYNERPDLITWTDEDELPTSPFYPEDLEGAGFSLHPTVRNGVYNISIYRTASYINNFTAYMVCAPPAYNITFNSIDSNTATLPINNLQQVSIYVDAKTTSPEYDLWELTPGDVGNTVVISPTSSNNLNFFKLKYQSNLYDYPHEFAIKGNNVRFDLYSGLNQPTQVRSVSYYDPSQGLFVKYFDSSMNLNNDASGVNQVSDVSYSYYIFTDSSNTLISANIYSGPIDSITTDGQAGIIQAVKNAGGVSYDISFSQPLDFCDANNYGLNIQLRIDNAFLPPVTSYLPLPTTVSTSVAFYEAITRYNNGQYNVYLNKYWNGTEDEDDSLPLLHGYNYNYILATNSNVRELGFRINRKSQKVICLSVDSSGIPNGQLTFTGECSHDVQQLLDQITPLDLSGLEWNTTELDSPVNIGISLSAYDLTGLNGLRDVFTYNNCTRLLNKTLYIERDDIFRVSSFFGQPVFRITNSGNVVTNKISTALLSIYEQSETTRQLPNFDSNTNVPGLFSPPGVVPASIVGENTLDFSGNYLTPLQQFPNTG